MYGIALIVIIAAMGGAIAYIGDRLGSKVGKKKLSIFGLRPKHTSILVTIVTGILIAAVTLGTMNAVSVDVRTALFGMEKLKSEMVFLNTEVVTKTRELEVSHAELSAKNEEYSVLTDKIEETLLRLKNITAERDRTADELEDLQANYNAAELELKKSRQEISGLMVTKKELDERIKDLSNARDNLQADVESLKTLAENLHQGIQNMRAGTVVLRAGEMLTAVVLKAGQNAKTAEENLTRIIYQTNQVLLSRFGVDDKNLEILWVNQIDFDRAVNELTNKNEDMIVRISTSGNTIYGEPIIGYIDLFPNRLIYKKGQVVYSEIFHSTDNEQQAEETILVFLHKVNSIAIENGVLPDPLSGTVGSMSGAKLFDAINKIKRHPSKDPGQEKIEVVAVAVENISAVGPLQIDIRIRSVL